MQVDARYHDVNAAGGKPKLLSTLPGGGLTHRDGQVRMPSGPAAGPSPGNPELLTMQDQDEPTSRHSGTDDR